MSSRNMFRGCENVTELVYQLVGAASTCWVDGTGDRVFDDADAKDVAEDGIARLIELGWAPENKRRRKVAR
jgi:hypothetical protein